MPAPKALSGLPKPLLFGLYGAVGGLLGAVLLGELAWRLLKPPTAEAPTHQVGVAASPEVEVFVEGRNSFPVQIARSGFDGPVTVRLEDLPSGVSAAPVVIPAGKTEGEVVAVGSSAAAVGTRSAKLVAEAEHEGKKATADTSISLKVWDPPRALADVVFVLDVTASMQWAIDDLKNGIGKFADALGKARVDFRLGLVTFRDLSVPGEGIDVVKFGTKGEPFTSDGNLFREQTGTLRASGGGDIPESSFEAIEEATKLPFRPTATKVLLLITDAPPKASRVSSVGAERAVKTAGIDSVHVVIQRFDLDAYTPLTKAGVDKAAGKYFNLGDVVRGDEGFDPILSTFGSAVTEAARAKVPESKPTLSKDVEKPTLKSLQGGEGAAAGSEGKLVVRSGVWAGAVAALVCLALLAGQHHYLRGTLPGAGGMVVGFAGGLAAGFAGGAAGQGLYLLAQGGSVLGTVFQVLGWALLGGLAGAGLSFFIPNMKWTLGLAGGAIGGAVGAAGFLAVSSAAGDLVGRLVGGLVVGFCIGLMVAIVEAAFRRAWLEVRYGARETVTVTLGPEPVKVGGDAKMCTVWARNAAPLALRFFVRDGNVICDDVEMKRETPVGDGYAKEVGNVTVTVRTGAGGGSAPPAPPPRPPAPPRRVSSDDDEFDLPMPISPPPARPAAATPPAPPPVPKAPAPPSVPPAPKPVPPPAPKPVAPVAAPKPLAPAAPKPPAAPPPRPPAPVAVPKSVPPAPKPAPPVPPKPAAPAGPRNPDACPGCGRIVSGKPKQRYCMVCDNTF